jgi:hypothetical protein
MDQTFLQEWYVLIQQKYLSMYGIKIKLKFSLQHTIKLITFINFNIKQKQKQNKLRGLSLLANYTDRVTAAFW